MASEQERYHGGLREVRDAMRVQVDFTLHAKNQAEAEQERLGRVNHLLTALAEAVGELVTHHTGQMVPTQVLAHNQLQATRRLFEQRFPETQGRPILGVIATALAQLEESWNKEARTVGSISRSIQAGQTAVDSLDQQVFEPLTTQVAPLHFHYDGLASSGQEIITNIEVQTGIS